MSEVDWLPRRQLLRVSAEVGVPLLIVACLLTPAMMTAATTPPAVVPVVPKRVPAIHVHPFEGLSGESCILDPPLHIGPSSREGTLKNEGALRDRMTNAVARCEGDWHGYVTVTARIDDIGSIRDVRADAGGDGWMSTCVIRNAMRGGQV